MDDKPFIDRFGALIDRHLDRWENWLILFLVVAVGLIVVAVFAAVIFG